MSKLSLIRACRQIATAVVGLAGVIALAALASSARADTPYVWNQQNPSARTKLLQTISPPDGFERIAADRGSWAYWLRRLPMKPKDSPVLLHTGAPKWRQDVHAAVIDIDVGRRNLQQCADAIMRLRAEWLFASNRHVKIKFNNTKGKPLIFRKRAQASYKRFRKYMTRVFAYAGTYSLERELVRKKTAELSIGDVFIKGGFPGHAVLVVDVAVNPETGAKKFLLMQSYMPAQDMHILKNPQHPTASPWYDVVPGKRLVTPEWEFAQDALRTWPAGS